ncbi:MAG: hypothetical protein JXO49_12530 [Deltaproteobacteria bacterium]|nr:hypothetical protein [Candidatus Anaeroferrophillus wilburensis]MBN2890154.1 hypothetical protein [Deltaproteobacteria bacterium]
MTNFGVEAGGYFAGTVVDHLTKPLQLNEKYCRCKDNGNDSAGNDKSY